MEGKIVLITGANSGIGKATAIGLAKMGARIIMLCRNKARAGKAKSEMISKSGNSDVSIQLVDLTDFSSIHAG